MSDKTETLNTTAESDAEVSRFAESYASFNRIINSLQRKYLELKEEFSTQNNRLAETNQELMDMTARNLAVNEFLNSILGGISAGVIAVDSAGRITHFNAAASVMLGIPLRHPFGKAYRDTVPPGEPIDANALRAMETGQAVDAIEKRVTLADGSLLIVSTSTSILKGDDGLPIGAVEVFHDLTRIKKMEQKIARLNTLAALGEMAAAVAHQVRNPLSGILGYGSLLKRDLDADDPRQKLVSKINDGVETLNQTVTTLLNYTRNEEVNRDRVLFSEFLHDSLAQFKRESGHRSEAVEFNVEKTGEPDDQKLEVSIDPILFRQVLFNLFANAAEASPTGTIVTISYRKLPRQKAAEEYAGRLLLDLDETIFELVVTDNGPGLEDSVKNEVFAPFFTTKDGGVGLGLAVASKIMKAHGGDIMSDNSYTGGARFKLLLPVRVRQVARENKPPVNNMETRP